MNEYNFFYYTVSDGVDKEFECKAIDLDSALNRFLNYLLSDSEFSMDKYHVPPFCLENGLYKYYSDKDIKNFLYLLSSALKEKNRQYA